MIFPFIFGMFGCFSISFIFWYEKKRNDSFSLLAKSIRQNKIDKNKIINCKLNSQPSDKLNTFSGKYYNIFKEFNLNNGFSVSYFKNIKQINDFNKYEIIKQKSQFPSWSNKFKITFDSGDFNIPLVSSSIKLKEYKIK